MWYYSTVGHGMCPIVDTWWANRDGRIMITSDTRRSGHEEDRRRYRSSA